MFKLFVIAATLACANGYYNHGPISHGSYYGNYAHPLPSAPLSALNAHHGNIYNHGYGHIGALSSQTKIIPATYPGAVHKHANYAIANPTGYLGAEYAGHGSVNHGVAGSYVQSPPAIVPHPTIAYNHGPPATNYAHSHYAVTEGPTNYAAHSRYAIATAPSLSYGHQARYPIAHAAGPIYSHGAPVDHGIQKISYNPAVSHMGYQNHGAHSYSW